MKNQPQIEPHYTLIDVGSRRRSDRDKYKRPVGSGPEEAEETERQREDPQALSIPPTFLAVGCPDLRSKSWAVGSRNLPHPTAAEGATGAGFAVRSGVRVPREGARSLKCRTATTHLVLWTGH